MKWWDEFEEWLSRRPMGIQAVILTSLVTIALIIVVGAGYFLFALNPIAGVIYVVWWAILILVIISIAD